MKHCYRLIMLFIMLFFHHQAKSQPIWGRLANPGFENQYIRSTFFFAGDWRNGSQFYEYKPSNNTGLYTMHPSDFRHLGWSENISYRNFAINAMIDAGVNVINLSYWGPRGTDNWAFWAPMQTSTWAHDELFDATIGKNILVAPYIESFAPTDSSEGYAFRDCFPGDSLNPAPQLVAMIEDLVDRYLINPANERWPEVWARVYDQDGVVRHIISVIHVASNQDGIDDQKFAKGYDRIADKIFDDTGILIGFFLDALPVATYSPGNYKITPENVDIMLASQKSILGIQCFIPEIWTGYNNDNDLIAWKRNYSQKWNNTTIPFIMDVSPGYNASVTFPESMVYGNNQTWRDSLMQMVKDIQADGITVNTWNGYTEGFAVVPTLEYGGVNYTWVTDLFGIYNVPDTITDIEQTFLFKEGDLVYPNPVNDELHIQTDNSLDVKISYEIFSLQGELLLTDEIRSSAYVEIGSLSKGVYLLQLYRNGFRIKCHKIIKE
jgi:hypothetical protein